MSTQNMAVNLKFLFNMHLRSKTLFTHLSAWLTSVASGSQVNRITALLASPLQCVFRWSPSAYSKYTQFAVIKQNKLCRTYFISHLILTFVCPVTSDTRMFHQSFSSILTYNDTCIPLNWLLCETVKYCIHAVMYIKVIFKEICHKSYCSENLLLILGYEMPKQSAAPTLSESVLTIDCKISKILLQSPFWQLLACSSGWHGVTEACTLNLCKRKQHQFAIKWCLTHFIIWCK